MTRDQGGATASASPLDRLLAVPLVGKLVGANSLLVVVAAIAIGRRGWLDEAGVVTVVALVASFAVNVFLVWLALRPLSGLETMASRVHDGDYAARVPPSRLADRDMRRVGETLNELVDRLTGDRARMRDLAVQVIRAQDEERARVARELHDSTAQTLAAVLLHLRAVPSEHLDPAATAKLAVVRDSVADALEEVRTMAHQMYPRILDDLGLGAALQRLASRAEDATGTPVRFEDECLGASLPREVASVLYRVAQEALGNALSHSSASSVGLRVAVDDRAASIEVTDDGRGFDPADRTRSGMGTFTMRERVALVNGTLEIESAPGVGTRVRARVPLG
jgi:signal transduction histidine kinase